MARSSADLSASVGHAARLCGPAIGHCWSIVLQAVQRRSNLLGQPQLGLHRANAAVFTGYGILARDFIFQKEVGGAIN